LSPITEDQTGNPGEQISTIVGASVSDVDAGASEGIAVTQLSSGAGTWEYSTDGGATWQSVGSVRDSKALLLRDTDRIRFVPDAHNADAAAFDFRAWDRTSGVFGTKVDATATGGSHAFSTAGDRASVTVGAVNDAPGLGDTALAPVAADAGDPAGESVAALFAGRFSDVDSGSSLAGVAVVGNGASPGGEGAWSYSSDGGASWSPIGGVSDGTGALALDAGTRVRFVPAPGFEGDPTSLVVRGLDDSYAGGFSSTAGGSEIRVQVDTSSHGGTSAIAGKTSRVATSVGPAIAAEPDPGGDETPVGDPTIPPEAEDLPDSPSGDVAEPEPETPEPDTAPAADPTPGPIVLGNDPAEPAGGSSFRRPVVFGESLTPTRQEVEVQDLVQAGAERQEDVRDPVLERGLRALSNALSGQLGFLDPETGFLDQLDRLRDDLEEQELLQQTRVGTSSVLAAGLSIGYVIWLTRGGLLIASLVSSIPVWRLVDPIPVLASLRVDDDENRGDDESLDSLVQQGASGEAPEAEGRLDARRLEDEVSADRDPAGRDGV
jgi:hypothetical protein